MVHRKARAQLDTGSTLCKFASATSIWSFVRIDKHRWRLPLSKYPKLRRVSALPWDLLERLPLLARRVGLRMGNVTQPTLAFDVAVASFATKIDHSGHFRLSPKSRSTADIADGPVRAQTV